MDLVVVLLQGLLFGKMHVLPANAATAVFAQLEWLASVCYQLPPDGSALKLLQQVLAST